MWLQVIVQGPERARRRAMSEVPASKGQGLGALACGVLAEPADDVVIADMRGGGGAGKRAVAEALRAESRPAVILAADAQALADALWERSAPSVVVVGDASEAGYRVALATCRALRGAAPAQRPGWRVLLAGGATAVESRS